MFWYILFVRTGNEYQVEQLLKKRLDGDMFKPFVPIHESLFKSVGTIKKEIKPLFPSYVFVESELSSQEFLKNTSNLIYTSSNIISLLRYSDAEIAMRESERQMLLSLCNDEYCIESSSGIIEKDRIIITDGPLKGRESIVKKVDRHKRQAYIEIDFLGETRLIGVAIELVKKIQVNKVE